MKLTHILSIICLILFASCNNDDTETYTNNALEGLQKVQEFSTTNHTIEVYTKNGVFETGYNDISLRVKNNDNDSYYENLSIEWIPMMNMGTMNHSCPKSTIAKVEESNTLYNGNLVFQMTGMNGSGWELKFNYTINDQNYSITENITVIQSDTQNVTTFTGSDTTKYIIAYISPTRPEIAVNNLKVGLYKMENMLNFPKVPNYSIGLDPRMPSMGNHSSPNNTDLSYNNNDGLYYGNLSLTMTGFWVLNLKLYDQDDNLLKGEDITDTNTQSSLYLELEF